MGVSCLFLLPPHQSDWLPVKAGKGWLFGMPVSMKDPSSKPCSAMETYGGGCGWEKQLLALPPSVAASDWAPTGGGQVANCRSSLCLVNKPCQTTELQFMPISSLYWLKPIGTAVVQMERTMLSHLLVMLLLKVKVPLGGGMVNTQDLKARLNTACPCLAG